MIGVTFSDRHSFLCYFFFQAGETPVLTSVLLSSSQLQQAEHSRLCASYFANKFFFPTVFFPSGEDTMQIYFHKGSFPPDFLSLHPSNQTHTLTCQKSEQPELTPFSAFLGKCFFCLFQPFHFLSL